MHVLFPALFSALLPALIALQHIPLRLTPSQCQKIVTHNIRAINGDKTTHTNFCQSTNTKLWEFLLTSDFIVTEIVLFLRDDFLEDRETMLIDNYGEIFVDGVLCSNVSMIEEARNPVIIKCTKGMRGSMITLKFSKKLVLCEVEVMGKDVPFEFTNLDKPISVVFGEDLEYKIGLNYPKNSEAPILTISYAGLPNLFINNHTLIIKNATREIEGEYILIAIGKKEKVSTDVIKINVLGKSPTFISPIHKVTIPRFLPVHISSTAVGIPAPDLTLTRILSESRKLIFTGVNITKDNRVSVLSFVMDRPELEDGGWYLITATNEYGENEYELEVEVITIDQWNVIAMPRALVEVQVESAPVERPLRSENIDKGDSSGSNVENSLDYTIDWWTALIVTVGILVVASLCYICCRRSGGAEESGSYRGKKRHKSR